jgi:hypothetical protein
MNNFEKIKQMTVEEIAKTLYETKCVYCTYFYSKKQEPCDVRKCLWNIEQWLLQEVEE